MQSVHFQLPDDLLASVDRARGDVPRNAWLRRAVEQALSEAKEPGPNEQADPGSVSSSEGVRSAAPAEQPRHGRVGPKRDVQPRPKKGK